MELQEQQPVVEQVPKKGKSKKEKKERKNQTWKDKTEAEQKEYYKQYLYNYHQRERQFARLMKIKQPLDAVKRLIELYGYRIDEEYLTAIQENWRPLSPVPENLSSSSSDEEPEEQQEVNAHEENKKEQVTDQVAEQEPIVQQPQEVKFEPIIVGSVYEKQQLEAMITYMERTHNWKAKEIMNFLYEYKKAREQK
jgi:hypothetical protein